MMEEARKRREAIDAEIKRLTPTAKELRELAERHPPPQEWYEHEEPLPFGEDDDAAVAHP